MTDQTALHTLLKQYVADRSTALLQEHAFHWNELVLIIHDELRFVVSEGVSEYTNPRLGNGQLSLDRNMRLRRQP